MTLSQQRITSWVATSQARVRKARKWAALNKMCLLCEVDLECLHSECPVRGKCINFNSRTTFFKKKKMWNGPSHQEKVFLSNYQKA